MMLVAHQQIKDTPLSKTKCKEGLIRLLLHLMIHLEGSRESTVDRDQQRQTKHKCSLIEDHLATRDSQDKEVPTSITRCLKSTTKDLCNHKMRYLQFQLDLILAKIINLCNQKEQVQEILSVDNQLKVVTNKFLDQLQVTPLGTSTKQLKYG